MLQEGIRVVLRIRSSSLTDNYCVAQIVDGAGVDKYSPFAAKITRQSDGTLRLQGSGKTILSSTLFSTNGEGLGDEAGFLQPITLAQPLVNDASQRQGGGGGRLPESSEFESGLEGGPQRASIFDPAGSSESEFRPRSRAVNLLPYLEDAQSVALKLGKNMGLRGTTLNGFVSDKVNLVRERLRLGEPYSPPKLYQSDIDIYRNVD